MANLMESYKGRLSISEKYYASQNNGAKMSSDKKMTTAMCLANTAKFINEAFDNSVGTQRSDLGKFKLFCMDITTLTMPNLVVNDLFMVQPMASISGYLTYMQYGLGTEKGGVGGRNADGTFKTVVASPFTMGEVSEGRVNYGSERVVESFAFADAGTDHKTLVLAWPASIADAALAGGKVTVAGEEVAYTAAAADGVITITLTTALTDGQTARVAYVYDNISVPQAKLPTLVGRMEGITLAARARRIAVYYSQIAAFQAKNDYGVDFESTINQQAQAELSYEIDAEAVSLIKQTADAAVAAGRIANITWADEELDTISYSMKAEGFAKKIEQAKMEVYKRTQKFMPTWMLVSPDMMPIITFVPGFKASSNVVPNGPYVAGEIAGMKLIVSPALGDKVCYLGVLGKDGKTAVGVYAPYLPIIPTQLLGFADGGMEQGFSTMYAMEILNEGLLSKITVTNGDGHADVNTFAQTV